MEIQIVVKELYWVFFTPFSNNNYKDLEVGKTKFRKNISFRKRELEDVITILKKDLLSNFEISLYGGEDGKTFKDFESNQLGLF